MSDKPEWQLPAPSETTRGENAYIPKSAKYHCFIDGVSVCGRYTQDVVFYDALGIESGEILRNPDIACKRCCEIWIHRYVTEEVTP